MKRAVIFTARLRFISFLFRLPQFRALCNARSLGIRDEAGASRRNCCTVPGFGLPARRESGGGRGVPKNACVLVVGAWSYSCSLIGQNPVLGSETFILEPIPVDLGFDQDPVLHQ